MCLQSVRACSLWVGDGVRFEECACELVLRGEVNPCGVAVAKASLNRANESRGLDPKRSDLPMARVKRR